MVPPVRPHNAQVSQRRALAKLAALGLVVVRAPGQRVYNDDGTWSVPRFMLRTPIGEAIVARYDRELRTGQPLRWDTRVAEAVAEAQARCSHQ